MSKPGRKTNCYVRLIAITGKDTISNELVFHSLIFYGISLKSLVMVLVVFRKKKEKGRHLVRPHFKPMNISFDYCSRRATLLFFFFFWLNSCHSSPAAEASDTTGFIIYVTPALDQFASQINPLIMVRCRMSQMKPFGVEKNHQSILFFGVKVSP